MLHSQTRITWHPLSLVVHKNFLPLTCSLGAKTRRHLNITKLRKNTSLLLYLVECKTVFWTFLWICFKKCYTIQIKLLIWLDLYMGLQKPFCIIRRTSSKAQRRKSRFRRCTLRTFTFRHVELNKRASWCSCRFALVAQWKHWLPVEMFSCLFSVCLTDGWCECHVVTRF